MKLLKPAVIAIFLTGCASGGTPVYSIGKDTYTLTNGLQHAAIRDASGFCMARNRHLRILRERQLDDSLKSTVLDFQCVTTDSPTRNDPTYEVETRPDITIEKR